MGTAPPKNTMPNAKSDAFRIQAGKGRPKGRKNKVTLERERAIAASGLTPLEFMLVTLRDEAHDLETRMDAAKSAAPYCHPKLATVEHTGAGGGAIKHVFEASDELLAAIAMGKSQ